MSHFRAKTQYNCEGSHGATVIKTLYVDHNLSSDYVTFYDELGRHIMTIPDTIENNLLDAINRLYNPSLTNVNSELDNEDYKILGLK